MSEGDAIWRLARRLTASLGGIRVEHAEFRRRTTHPVAFTGKRLLEVVPRGKHVLMRFDDGTTMHSHLSMEGSWQKHRSGWRPRRDDDAIGVWLDFGEPGVLAAHSVPVLDIISTADEHTVVGHLGPDILTDEFDMALAVVNVSRSPGIAIREAILDQRNLCGIGNLWAVEALFIAGVHPFRTVADVDVRKVVDVARRMMRLGLRNGNMVTTGNTRRGHTHWVYGRYKQPCRRCGTPVAFRDAGSGPYDRATWWCPYCQPD